MHRAFGDLQPTGSLLYFLWPVWSHQHSVHGASTATLPNQDPALKCSQQGGGLILLQVHAKGAAVQACSIMDIWCSIEALWKAPFLLQTGCFSPASRSSHSTFQGNNSGPRSKAGARMGILTLPGCRQCHLRRALQPPLHGLMGELTPGCPCAGPSN